MVVGVVAGATGYVVEIQADKKDAENAVYRRELGATIHALESDSSLSKALPKTLRYVEKTALGVAESMNLKVKVVSEPAAGRSKGDTTVRLKMKNVSHSQVVRFIVLLEHRGFLCKTLLMVPDPENGTYKSVLIELPGGIGEAG